MKKRTWRDADVEEMALVGRDLQKPILELSEKVGRFESPYSYLKAAMGGFAAPRRFLLNKTLAGDLEAIAVRDDIAMVRRHWRLNEPLVSDRDLEREWGETHHAAYQAFAREHYPWLYSSGELLNEPDARVDAMLDHYICEELAEYGFTIRTRKFKQNYWRCHSSLLSRRMTIEFDKGTYLPSTKMTGDLVVEDFRYRVSLGDPFFFSGCVFHTSMADQLETQVERFFSEYIRIFPHVVKALEEGIAAAEGVLSTLKRSVS